MGDLDLAAKFRGGNGKWLTKSLFIETSYEDTSNVEFTLKDRDVTLDDGRKLPSLKRIYLELADPLEWDIATRYLGGWQHWVELTKTVLKDQIEDWRHELDLKLQSAAFYQLKELADAGDRMANQFIAKKEYKNKRRAGAPSKEEKAGALKEHVSKVTRIDEHLKRIKS